MTAALTLCSRCSIPFVPLRCHCGQPIMLHEVWVPHEIVSHFCDPWVRDLLIRGGR